MKKKSEILAISNGLYGALTTKLDTAPAVAEIDVKAINTSAFDAAHALIEGVKNTIDTIVKGVDFEGTFSNQFLTSMKSYELDGKLDYIELTIKSRLKAEYPYRHQVVLKNDANIVKAMCEAYCYALIQLLYIEFAGENIKEANKMVAELIAENEIPFTFEFTISDTNAMISSITDEKVVFVANIENAFELSRNPLFQSGDEYSDRVRETAVAAFVERMKSVQTTTQLIKAGVDIITELTGVKTKKRADKLIRQVYHKKAIHFNAVKSGIGYYEGTAKVDGEETEIFALLEKKEDGSIDVILAPFDIKTLFVVKADVLKKVKAALK